MKKILVIIGILLFAVNGYCGFFGPNGMDIETKQAIAGASGSNYSSYFKLEGGLYHAIGVRFTSAGSVNVDLELEQGYIIPETDEASDTNWVIPENTSTLLTVTDEVWHYLGILPTAVPYARIKIDKGSGNDASTTMELKYFKLEM